VETRDKDVANVQPREEMRRIFNLLSWIFVYGLAIYWAPATSPSRMAPGI